MPNKTTKFVDFKAVKSAVTMEQVLDHYGLLPTLKRNGDSLSGPCPIHKGTNPTQFRVSISKNCWNCFSECKHGGNVLDFVARMDNITVRQAAIKIAEWFHLDAEFEPSDDDEPAERESPKGRSSPPPAESKAKPEPSARVEEIGSNKPLGFTLQNLDSNHAYLAERGLTPETVAEFGLGYCAKGSMAGRIVIPIHNANGELLAYAGRWPGEPEDKDTPKYKLPKDFKKLLEVFNLHRAIREPAEKPLVIVEGFFDAIRLWQHGCRKVVALMGSTLSAAQAELIRQHTNAGSHVIVMLDEDEAGQFGREDIAAHLSRFCFVKTHVFDQPNTQPEQLSAEDLSVIVGGLS